MQLAREEAEKQLVRDIRASLTEFKEKMHDELELSSFNKRQTPTAVLNYLMSIVDKYLDFMPEQPVLYGTLVQFRENELLRCLLNVSIYLGTIEKPETFIIELRRLCDYQERVFRDQEATTRQQQSILDGIKRKKDRRKVNAMMEKQQLQSQCSILPLNGRTVSLVPLLSNISK